LAAGVVWRCWEDGCVVFCAATAQTLLLAPEFRDALAWGSRCGRGSAQDAGFPAPSFAVEPERVGQLVELGILE
jgi:hypothetical protein